MGLREELRRIQDLPEDEQARIDSLPARRTAIRAVTLCAIVILAVTLGSWAFGAAPVSSGPRNALLAWSAVTTNTDGTPVTQTITYRIYAGHSGILKNNIAETTDTSILLLDEPLGERCYQVTAYVKDTSLPDHGLSLESELSEERCKVMRPPAPTEGAIEAPSDGGIEYPRRN